jgi:hypothetical protein
MSEVEVIFELDEDVTPEIFASKVAFAVSTGCLRPGEKVWVHGDDGQTHEWEIRDPGPEPPANAKMQEFFDHASRRIRKTKP